MGELFLMCKTKSCSHQRFVRFMSFRAYWSVNNGKEPSILIKCVCVYVHMCVCVWERDRERERGKLTCKTDRQQASMCSLLALAQLRFYPKKFNICSTIWEKHMHPQSHTYAHQSWHKTKSWNAWHNSIFFNKQSTTLLIWWQTNTPFTIPTKCTATRHGWKWGWTKYSITLSEKHLLLEKGVHCKICTFCVNTLNWHSLVLTIYVWIPHSGVCCIRQHATFPPWVHSKLHHSQTVL